MAVPNDKHYCFKHGEEKIIVYSPTEESLVYLVCQLCAAEEKFKFPSTRWPEGAEL